MTFAGEKLSRMGFCMPHGSHLILSLKLLICTKWNMRIFQIQIKHSDENSKSFEIPFRYEENIQDNRNWDNLGARRKVQFI